MAVPRCSLAVVGALLALLRICCIAGAEGGVSYDLQDLSNLKIRELKDLLRKKGKEAECVACVEKADLVARVLETKDWPDVQEEPEDLDLGLGDEDALFGPGDEDEKIRILKEALEKQGIDTSKMFVPGGKDNEKLQEVLRNWEEQLKKKKKNGKENESEEVEDVVTGEETGKTEQGEEADVKEDL